MSVYEVKWEQPYVSMIQSYKTACVYLGRLLISDEFPGITGTLCHTSSLHSKAAPTSGGVQFIISLTLGAGEDTVTEQHLPQCTPDSWSWNCLQLKQADFPLKNQINTEEEFYQWGPSVPCCFESWTLLLFSIQLKNTPSSQACVSATSSTELLYPCSISNRTQLFLLLTDAFFLPFHAFFPVPFTWPCFLYSG